ncbi:hypothetical protein BXZ70DRAFT_898119 [Cristinia sonorae]|uniref:F-box domain-containing protein n=1 Tax=Cristinia sonorae TaxID=1940300 RepID=A0A8K0XM32_9AGAR|nr:hypothetical protein BXZ70DRAFT_898119 [Cristinia sonorae]
MEATSLGAPVGEHIFLDRIVFNHLIFESIFDNLTPLEFLRFARTCRLAQSVVQGFIKRTFQINRILSRFFDDPVAFRSLQARTGTLISGSVALQFLDRTFYPESDLDIYIPPQFDREVLLWLTKNGYQFVPTKDQPATLDEAIKLGRDLGFVSGMVDDPEGYSLRPIQAVYTFRKFSLSADGSKTRVQCIVAVSAPLEVVSFHSTCVMNVISYEKAYCIYPRATLHEHCSLNNELYSSPTRPEALQKYTTRGFKFCRSLRHIADIDLGFRVAGRYIGDSLCWTLSLNTDGVGSGCVIPGTHEPLA